MVWEVRPDLIIMKNPLAFSHGQQLPCALDTRMAWESKKTSWLAALRIFVTQSSHAYNSYAFWDMHAQDLAAIKWLTAFRISFWWTTIHQMWMLLHLWMVHFLNSSPSNSVSRWMWNESQFSILVLWCQIWTETIIIWWWMWPLSLFSDINWVFCHKLCRTFWFYFPKKLFREQCS